MQMLMVPAEGVDPVDVLSANTLARCQAALRQWQTGGYDLLLITGGQFLPPSHQRRPTAHGMREWFLEQGVAAADIVMEDRSLDTYQNVEFSLVRIRHRPDDEITVVTQFQHTIRFQLTFWLAHGIKIRTHAVRQPAMRWVPWILEWFVLIPMHLFDPHGNRWLARWNRTRRDRNRACGYAMDCVDRLRAGEVTTSNVGILRGYLIRREASHDELGTTEEELQAWVLALAKRNTMRLVERFRAAGGYASRADFNHLQMLLKAPGITLEDLGVSPEEFGRWQTAAQH